MEFFILWIVSLVLSEVDKMGGYVKKKTEKFQISRDEVSYKGYINLSLKYVFGPSNLGHLYFLSLKFKFAFFKSFC